MIKPSQYQRYPVATTEFIPFLGRFAPSTPLRSWLQRNWPDTRAFPDATPCPFPEMADNAASGEISARESSVGGGEAYARPGDGLGGTRGLLRLGAGESRARCDLRR